MSRKIPPELENPIDLQLYRLAAHVGPVLHACKITPNMVTTAGIVLALIGARAMWKGNLKTAFTLMWIRYFFDNLDGWMARTYKQISKLGDVLDHVSDILSGVLYLYTINHQLQPQYRYLFYAGTVFMFLMQNLQLGCQEKYYGKPEESATLNILSKMCNDPVKTMKWSRYFGSGSFWLYMTLMPLLLRRK